MWTKSTQCRHIQLYTYTSLPTALQCRHDLDFRRNCLEAESIQHLCKSIVMENTKLTEPVPGVSKYYCVIVQVTFFNFSCLLRGQTLAVQAGVTMSDLCYSVVGQRRCSITPPDKTMQRNCYKQNTPSLGSKLRP